ncbi:MAG: peptidoglycan binding domain-containing protein, partial [Patescibacteria group bacterium]
MKQHIQTFTTSLTPRILGICGAIVAGLLIISGGAYAAFFTPTIRPHVLIASIPVGGLNYEQALVEVARQTDPLLRNDIGLVIEGTAYYISPAAIGLSYDTRAAVDAAWSIGREGTPLSQVQIRAATLLTDTSVALPITFDSVALHATIDAIADQVEITPKDVRLVFSGKNVTIATDTAPGRIIDHQAVKQTIEQALAMQQRGPFTIALTEVIPSGNEASAIIAKEQAERVLKSPLVLTHDRDNFTINPEMLATWLKSTVENGEVIVIANIDAIS